MDHVLWLYGVTHADQALPQALPCALEAIPHRSFSAIVERVPRAEFTPEALEVRMKSLEWIGATARRHQQVLSALLDAGPVIPARLCTLFSSRGAVEEALEAGRSRFSDSLDRLAGCREWGLKVYCDERRLAAELAVRASEAEIDAPALSPGRAYVLAKQREARASEQASERVDQAVDEILDALEPVIAEAVERPLGARAKTDGATQALNLAVLLARGSEEAFQAVVEAEARRLGPEGFCFELSGPWAPYGFCNLDAPASA